MSNGKNTSFNLSPNSSNEPITSNLEQIKLELANNANANNPPKKSQVFLYQRHIFSAEMSMKDPRYFIEPFHAVNDTAAAFNIKLFFEISIYHILFYMILGPLTALVMFARTRNLIYAKNLGFWGWNRNMISQLPIFLINFIGLYIYFSSESVKNIYTIEIIILICGCVCRSFIISIKYAFFPEKKMNYVKYKQLSNEDIHYEFMLQWYEQRDETIENELWSTVFRNNIEEDIFAFYFLRPLNPELKKNLEKMSKFEEEYRKENKNPTPDILFDDPDYYWGFSIARYLIKKYRTLISTKKILLFSLILSILHSFIPIFYRIAKDESLYGSNAIERTCIICIFIGNIYFYTLNFLFIIIGVFEYDRPTKLLSQLSNFLALKKVEKYHTKKIFPTINLFCVLSFRSWLTMNKIFQDYGCRFRKRIDMYLGFFLIYYIMILLICMLSIYEIIAKFYEVNYVIWGSEMVVTLSSLLYVIFKGAIVNDHFNIHIALLNELKEIVVDMRSVNEVLNENYKYDLNNEVYELGNRLTNHIATILYEKSDGRSLNEKKKDYLTSIINMNTFIKELLEFEKNNHPFKVLGIPATMSTLQSLVAGLGSAFTITFNKFYSG